MKARSGFPCENNASRKEQPTGKKGGKQKPLRPLVVQLCTCVSGCLPRLLLPQYSSWLYPKKSSFQSKLTSVLFHHSRHTVWTDPAQAKAAHYATRPADIGRQRGSADVRFVNFCLGFFKKLSDGFPGVFSGLQCFSGFYWILRRFLKLRFLKCFKKVTGGFRGKLKGGLKGSLKGSFKGALDGLEVPPH